MSEAETPSRRRPGRPPKKPEERLSRYSVTLPQGTRELAEAHGLTVSRLCRVGLDLFQAFNAVDLGEE